MMIRLKAAWNVFPAGHVFSEVGTINGMGAAQAEDMVKCGQAEYLTEEARVPENRMMTAHRAGRAAGEHRK